jgi:O-antigen/teichoic acid export membrane protein
MTFQAKRSRFTSQGRKWGRIVSVSLMEQLILSATSFVFVIVLASLIGGIEFGLFSIAWSFVSLLESLSWAFFGDIVPATANKIPMQRWPQVRSSLYLLSSAFSLAMVPLASAICVIWSIGKERDVMDLILASAVAIPAVRAQQMFRRLCFLDELRALALVGALIYAATLAAGFFTISVLDAKSASAGIGCLALAALASAAVGLSRARDFSRPNMRVVQWCAGRCWRSGRWLMATSIVFWLGNVGLIPVAGYLYGVEASGALRIVQNLMNPLVQTTAAVSTVILPHAAAKLKATTPQAIIRTTWLCVAAFAALSLLYGIFLTTAGETLARWLFPNAMNGITTGVLAVSSLGGVADSVRLGVAVPLLALSQTQAFLSTRLFALFTLFLALPLLIQLGQVASLVAAMSLSNLAAMIALVFHFGRFIKSRSPAIASGRQK